MEYSEIFSLLGTTEKAHIFLQAIDEVLIAMYQKTDSIEALLEKHLPKDQAQAVVVLLKKKDADNSREAVQKVFSELKTLLTTAKILHLTLAILPNEELLVGISSWVQQVFPGELILLEFEIDPAIIAGAVIIFEGRYWDMGVGKQVEEWFRNNKFVEEKNKTQSTEDRIQKTDSG